MFFLHVSNKTENLLKHLAAVIDADRSKSLFEKEMFLIQSRGMERMLSQGLADRFGCWCHFDYLLPFDFLEFIGTRLGLQITPNYYERDVLTWRLENLLREIDHPVYTQLNSYLQGENLDLKRFQLSRKLANIFDQYQMMRLDMLESWSENIERGIHPSEPWQAHLWRRLHDEHPDSLHRGILIKTIIDKLRGGDAGSIRLPQRVFVFGLHIMPPLFLACLNSLSLQCQIHLFLLSPSEQYWGDIDTKRRQVKQNIVRLKRGEEPLPVCDSQHPLLVTFGGQGGEFQKMLLDTVDFEIELNSFENPLDQHTPNLLHHLQSDLLSGEMVVSSEQSVKHTNDGSLKIVSTHSKVREVMILKDHILDWLQTSHDLELRDIIVMAPDIQEYAQLIPALFEDLPHSIADRNMGKRNTIAATFLDFLNIFTGRYGWSEVFDLFSQAPIHSNFEVSSADLDQLRHWVVDSGIRWGLSSEQREEQDLFAFDENSWSDGLARLLMGYAIDSDELVGDVLPYTDIEGSQAQPLGGLCHFIHLIDQARRDFSTKRSLSQWSKIFLDYVEKLFGEIADSDLVELRTIIGELHSKFDQFHQRGIEFAVISQWLRTAVAESRSTSGFLRGQLTFCSMLPMRSIPFQYVCLLGIDNGVFPENDRYATFDIMGTEHRWGDRSKRADDRYQFLEALVSARKCLYISYVGQSEKSNNPIPPSVVVTELIELLRHGYGIEDLVQQHPLQPFSQKYFTKDSGLFSYNKEYCHVAQQLADDKKSLEPWWEGELPDEPEQSVQLTSFFSFFVNPQRWFVKNRLGIRMDTKTVQVEEREVFELRGLDSYLVNQEIIEGCLGGDTPATILRKLQAGGCWPLGNPGEIAFQRKLTEIETYVETVKNIRIGSRIGDISVDRKVEGVHITGSVTQVHEKGMLLYRYSQCKGRDLLKGYIYMLLLSITSEGPQEVHVVNRDSHILFLSDTKNAPTLEQLITLYLEGWKKPTPLFVEPGWKYFQQQKKKKAKITPLEKSRLFFKQQIEKNEFDQSLPEPEWALLYGGCDPEMVINETFIEKYDTILERVFSAGRDAS